MTKIQKAFWLTYKHRYLPLLVALKNKQVKLFEDNNSYYIDSYFDRLFYKKYCEEFYIKFSYKPSYPYNKRCIKCPLGNHGINNDYFYYKSCFNQDYYNNLLKNLECYRRNRIYDIIGDSTEEERKDELKAEIARKKCVKLLNGLIHKHAKQAKILIFTSQL